MAQSDASMIRQSSTSTIFVHFDVFWLAKTPNDTIIGQPYPVSQCSGIRSRFQASKHLSIHVKSFLPSIFNMPCGWNLDAKIFQGYVMREYNGSRGVLELLEDASAHLAPEDSDKTEDLQSLHVLWFQVPWHRMIPDVYKYIYSCQNWLKDLEPASVTWPGCFAGSAWSLYRQQANHSMASQPHLFSCYLHGLHVDMWYVSWSTTVTLLDVTTWFIIHQLRGVTSKGCHNSVGIDLNVLDVHHSSTFHMPIRHPCVCVCFLSSFWCWWCLIIFWYFWQLCCGFVLVLTDPGWKVQSPGVDWLSCWCVGGGSEAESSYFELCRVVTHQIESTSSCGQVTQQAQWKYWELTWTYLMQVMQTLHSPHSWLSTEKAVRSFIRKYFIWFYYDI